MTNTPDPNNGSTRVRALLEALPGVFVASGIGVLSTVLAIVALISALVRPGDSTWLTIVALVAVVVAAAASGYTWQKIVALMPHLRS